MSELPEANLFQIALLRFDFRTRFRVEGDSMTPLLKAGDQVLVDKNAGIAAGDIVIARHPFKKKIKMIKRVKEIGKDNMYFLISDNLEDSTDSRSFGAVSSEFIKGRVVCRIMNHL